MDNKRLPYRDNDDDDNLLAHPCAVCGIQVPTWNDPTHVAGKPVYCAAHKPAEDDSQ